MRTVPERDPVRHHVRHTDSLDLIVLHSVAQYFEPDEAAVLFELRCS
jgi:hypothetical protein